MYESAFLDLHLSGVVAKRLRGVTKLPIEFQRDGIPDDELNRQLASPWMKELRKDIIMADFWGYSLFQFYLDEEGRLRYDLIPRKHYDPINQRLLRSQNDTEGRSIEEFENMLFVGKERSLGILAELMPAILYKRNNIGDWAKFCELFGIPIRKYTYDAGDEETRRRVLKDAMGQGVGAVYIMPKESNMEIIEAGNKSGSSELYKSFTDYWDRAISIRVLGNTLTTDASSTGTQALGTVHKEVEEEVNEDDCFAILDVLNYYLLPIFENLGFNVSGESSSTPSESDTIHRNAQTSTSRLNSSDYLSTLTRCMKRWGSRSPMTTKSRWLLRKNIAGRLPKRLKSLRRETKRPQKNLRGRTQRGKSPSKTASLVFSA